MLQGRKFDPDGAYVQTWVPENPRAYPKPIVDPAEGRTRALQAFETLRPAAARG